MGVPPRATLVSLDRTMVTNAAIPAVAKWPSLERLSINGTLVNDEGIECLAVHSKLYELLACNLQLTGACAKKLRTSRSLKYLAFADTALDDNALLMLMSIATLEDVYCPRSKVTDECVAKCQRLRPDVACRTGNR